MKVSHEPDLESSSDLTQSRAVRPALFGSAGSDKKPISGPRYQNAKAGTTDSVRSWIAEGSPGASNSEGGFIEDLVHLDSAYFDQLSLAVQRNQSSVLTPKFLEVSELKDRFNAWRHGESNLDQRLARAPGVRKQLLWNLIALTLDLSQGMNFYSHSMQRNLRKNTEKAVEQVADFAGFFPPKHSGSSLPINITEFLRKKCPDLKSSVDNLYALSPTINYIFENPDGRNNPSPTHAVGNRHSTAVVDKLASRIQTSLNRTVHRVRSSGRQGDTVSHHDADSRKIHPVSHISSAKQSSDSTGSSGVSSVFSNDGNKISTSPMTNTHTSHSTSRARNSTDDSEPYEIFGAHQTVLIRDGSHNEKDGPVLTLFDSGSDENLIVRTVVDQLRLRAQVIPPNETSIHSFNRQEFRATHFVTPNWRLKQGQKRHDKYRFIVVESLPADLEMVVGYTTYSEMGISFRAQKKNLVAFLTGKKDRRIQGQAQHTKQTLDELKRRTHIQTGLKKAHAIAGKLKDPEKLQPAETHKQAARGGGGEGGGGRKR